jgi:hypothetical protein
VAEVLGSGLADWLACRGGIFRPKNAAFLLVLGSSLLIHGVAVVGQSAQSPQAKKTSPPASTPPAAEPQSPPPAQIWLPPLQAPAHAPVISWDGKFLTIDAENSSLSDVLLGIRSRTGASIEMPASTNRERIALHLGPAPIREVLSSLLYGTNFNYVIQSADDDESALGKVILTARDNDQSGDTSAGDTVAGDGRPNPKIRLMPGYAAPGKRDFEVAHSNATDDSASTAAETPASADSSSSNPDQNATATDSAGTNQQTDTQPATANASDSTSPTDPTSLTAAEQPISGGAAGTVPGSGSSGSSSGGGTTLSQMEQNMQRLYQQRQQLQAQQGRAAQTPAP